MKTITTMMIMHITICLYAPVNILERIYIPEPCIYEIIEAEAGITLPSWTKKKHIEFMYEKAIEYGIPLRIMFRLVYNESRFKHDVTSRAGAYGYMQIMPKTYKYVLHMIEYPECTPHTPEINIELGVRYLAYLKQFWQGRGYDGWEYPLASYNAGVGRVLKAGGIPDIQETIRYVAFINN